MDLIGFDARVLQYGVEVSGKIGSDPGASCGWSCNGSLERRAMWSGNG